VAAGDVGLELIVAAAKLGFPREDDGGNARSEQARPAKAATIEPYVAYIKQNTVEIWLKILNCVQNQANFPQAS
jgi:hypothetical protein